MNLFTREKEENLSPGSVFVKLDSKGRVSIPSFLRKNLGLDKCIKIRLDYDLERNYVILIPEQNSIAGKTTTCNNNQYDLEKSSPANNGQDGVIGNTRGCGPLIPGSRRKRASDVTEDRRLKNIDVSRPVPFTCRALLPLYLPLTLLEYCNVNLKVWGNGQIKGEMGRQIICSYQTVVSDSLCVESPGPDPNTALDEYKRNFVLPGLCVTGGLD